MHLVSLTINNFRAFYGAQRIDFAPPGTKAVTVVHGENGSGKTNFLNALFWCLTGEFTPRLKNPEMLVNRAAYDEDRTVECYIDLRFHHDGHDYQVVRSVVGNYSKLSVYAIGTGDPTLIAKPELFIERLIPKALSRWFFFDAEAIGELELSGSERFRQSLRRILGFELVDTLSEDLKRCLTKKQGALAKLVNSKELEELQKKIANIEHILPAQREKSAEWEAKALQADAEAAQFETQLRALPQSKPLQDQRTRLTAQRVQRVAELKDLRAGLAKAVGDAAPAVFLFGHANAFEEQLRIKENTGRLPAPFSEQLVEDILSESVCVCGRPVEHGSAEETNIKALLKHASTSDFNARVRSVQFAIKDIRGANENLDREVKRLEVQIRKVDHEISETDSELKRIRIELETIDVEAIRSIEVSRSSSQAKAREAHQQHAILTSRIRENEAAIGNLRAQYDAQSKRIGQGKSVNEEIDKIKRLIAYVDKTLVHQELRALTVLQIELNSVLDRYLTKHFKARISPKTYQVELLDASGRPVGDSTGEGQVLKFAFITTVVALAGKKTQEKINFLAEPTIAPLVLDAPFSALDPEYQSSVAQNLATQTTQLVLLLSSAGWGEGVAKALDMHVGRRYALISRQAGARGAKPLKTMMLNGKQLALNEYESERDESVILEVQ
jgi:DNA sulfur modification protein DndD